MYHLEEKKVKEKNVVERKINPVNRTGLHICKEKEEIKAQRFCRKSFKYLDLLLC